MTNRRIGDVAKVIMGFSPKGSTYNNEGIGIPLLNGPTEFGPNHPSCSLFTTDSKRECNQGDLIFCVRGSTTGRMNWADKSYSLGRGVCAIRGKTNSDTKFIRYCLEVYLASLLKIVGGGTFPNLRQDDIKGFQIPFPLHRDSIVSIIAAYDDLIENNRRRIQLLEEMARALYREWFVHFRFPGHEDVEMVDSELGEIPEGWSIHLVEGLLKRLNKGEVYTEKDVNKEGDVRVIDQSRDEILGYHNNTPDFIATDNNPIAVFGDHTCKLQLLTTPFSVGPNVIPFISKVEYPLYYVFSVIEGVIETKEYKRHWNELIAKKALLSTLNLSKKYADVLQPTYRIISKLRDINRRIQIMRDLLLPKLVSGQIDVSELSIEIPPDTHKTSKYSDQPTLEQWLDGDDQHDPS